MLQAMETTKILDVIVRNVPGSYVRDHTANGGWIDVMRNIRPVKNASRNTVEEYPHETIINLPPGHTPRPAIWDGTRLVRPGWQKQLRQLRNKVTPQQYRRIIKELGVGSLGV